MAIVVLELMKAARTLGNEEGLPAARRGRVTFRRSRCSTWSSACSRDGADQTNRLQGIERDSRRRFSLWPRPKSFREFRSGQRFGLAGWRRATRTRCQSRPTAVDAGLVYRSSPDVPYLRLSRRYLGKIEPASRCQRTQEHRMWDFQKCPPGHPRRTPSGALRRVLLYGLALLSSCWLLSSCATETVFQSDFKRFAVCHLSEVRK